MAQDHAVFRARRQHAIGLVHAARHQVVDQHADVGVAAAEPDRRAPADRARGVDAGDQALRRRFLVARRPVELAAVEQSRDPARLERVAQLGRWHVIVFDRVARPEHLGRFEPRQRVQHRELHLGGQRRREAADVERLARPALGLDEDEMCGVVGELDDLVFDRRAVARADAADQVESVERRAVQVRAHEFVRPRVRRDDMTRKLRSGKRRRAAIRER